MATPHERVLADLDYLSAITALHQRVRVAHPTAGLYEAAELQWYWTVPRTTDGFGQLFWFDDADRPVAAFVVLDFGGGHSLLYGAPTVIVSVLPDAEPGWVAHVVRRGLAHLAASGVDAIELEVDRADEVQRAVLLESGFAVQGDALIGCWLDIDDRPPISPLAAGYRLTDRRELADRPHHMAGPRRPDFAARLGQISLYRPDLDLVVLDADDEPAGHAMFWYDPVTRTAVVEPVRTDDGHQRRGLSRHLLTSGLERVARAGAERVSIGYEPENPASGRFYRSIGFEPHRRTDLFAGPTSHAVVGTM